MHLSIFISVINYFMHKIFVLQSLYFMPLHVSNTLAYNQEVKIALYSLWYHHTMPLHVLTTFAYNQEVKLALHSIWYHHTMSLHVSSTFTLIRRSKLHYTTSGIITPKQVIGLKFYD